jgi:hypothetical protein
MEATINIEAVTTLFELIQAHLERKGYTHAGSFTRKTVSGHVVNPHTNGNIWVLVSPEGPNVYTINLTENLVTIENLQADMMSSWAAKSEMSLYEAWDRVKAGRLV